MHGCIIMEHPLSEVPLAGTRRLLQQDAHQPLSFFKEAGGLESRGNAACPSLFGDEPYPSVFSISFLYPAGPQEEEEEKKT